LFLDEWSDSGAGQYGGLRFRSPCPCSPPFGSLSAPSGTSVLLIAAVEAWPWPPFPGALFLLVHHALSVLLVVASLAALAAGWPK
jgi:hypothetical protein